MSNTIATVTDASLLNGLRLVALGCDIAITATSAGVTFTAWPGRRPLTAAAVRRAQRNAAIHSAQGADDVAAVWDAAAVAMAAV